MIKVLVTGAAGFIGFNLCNELIRLGIEVHGIDNLNNYYDPRLKQSRLDILLQKGIGFSKADISDKYTIEKLFHDFKPTIVINLAAQAGVRYSLENPYYQSWKLNEDTIKVIKSTVPDINTKGTVITQ